MTNQELDKQAKLEEANLRLKFFGLPKAVDARIQEIQTRLSLEEKSVDLVVCIRVCEMEGELKALRWVKDLLT